MASEIEAKLKTLAMIIKFGHDLFDRKNLKEIAARLMFEVKNECEIFVFDYRKVTLIHKC